jgi:predicted RecB family nuclease
MQLIDGRPVYSATDLVGFLCCEHLTELERSTLAGLVERPLRPDPELDRIRIRGEEHERNFLAGLEAGGRRVVDLHIPREAWSVDRGTELEAAAARTRDAILRGDDVLYQACFFDGTWLGFADFLLRVEKPTETLGWSYEVADTKLARHTKASALLQICSYVDGLTRVQGGEPEWMHVALGGSAKAVERFRVVDYMAYYRTVRRLFEAAVGRPLPAVYPPADTYPDPVEHCDVCRWAAVCQDRRRADDDLSLVAGIASRTRRELKDRGVSTRRAVAGLELPLSPRLEQTGVGALRRVRDQARIQVRGDDQDRPLYELLLPPRADNGELDTSKGLLALPEPDAADLFLDLEGDPFALDDGVDYLFGILEPGRTAPDGQPLFHAFWARDAEGRVTPEAEKAAFERAVDLISDRLAANPALHVYHYAPYEPTALGRLMGRYLTRELEIDRLLRGDVLVDLYRVVRQGLIASVESYSIKKLEPQYGYQREVDLRDAGSSIVAFETWLEVGGESGRDDETLARIERYNRDDVVSTWRLRDWLEERRTELGRADGLTLPRPGRPDRDEGPRLAAWLERVRAVAGPLTADMPKDLDAANEEQRARRLLADLLGWHRREAKASWWRFFHLRDDFTDEERVDEPEPIGMLELIGPVEDQPRTFRYRFPLQEHEVDTSRSSTDPAPEGEGRWKVTPTQLDDQAGEVTIRHPKTRPIHHPRSLVPDTVVPTEAMEESLLRIGEHVLAHGIGGEGRYGAARDLLLRHRPRVGLPDRSVLRIPWETPGQAARTLVMSLDRSCLPIQGPPGSGKTYTGARMILDLVRAGKRVGVTANSHKVIGNLLDAVWSAAQEEHMSVRLGQKPGSDEEPTCVNAAAFKENHGLLEALRSGAVDVAGATAWAWARTDFEGSVDVLFVDEAGQFSLANAVAVSQAANSLVLLGDPQQLDQPTQGSHPPGADRSALAHILDGQPTMPSDRGLFLERTWRLHPDICAFTSEVFYRGELSPEQGNERQDLLGDQVLSGTGIRFLGVPHAGNATDSPQEAAAVAELVAALLAAGAAWVARDGEERPIGLRDVLIVTPYNAHKARIERHLAGANVGTVDKFQGQEAPLSIYALGTSSPGDAPRGLDFLYSLNRLNVATSRARCLTVVVASPELLRVRALTPLQMRLASAFCRVVEVGEPVSLPAGLRRTP